MARGHVMQGNKVILDVAYKYCGLPCKDEDLRNNSSLTEFLLMNSNSFSGSISDDE